MTSQPDCVVDEFAGVNIYLEPGGIGERHWHQTAEWTIMTNFRVAQGEAAARTLMSGTPTPVHACTPVIFPHLHRAGLVLAGAGPGMIAIARFFFPA